MGLFRQLFGPSRDEVWAQLASEIGASFDAGGLFGRTVVRAQVREWIVTLDTYTVSTGKSSQIYTRIRAPYVNRDSFRFEVYRKSVFTEFGKMLGMQDVSIGDPWFDEEFVVKGNDEARLVRLFSNPKLRELIHAQSSIHLTVKDDEGWFGTTFPEGVDELQFMVHGVIKDVERLKLAFELFAVTLDELCKMGSAYEHDPGIVL